MPQIGFGIDIGGSGIKGAPVDLRTGEFTAERLRIETPRPGTPEQVAAVCKELLQAFSVPAHTPIGITFPAPIVSGIVPFCANLDDSWVGCAIDELFSASLGRVVYTVNDADAAGYAEAQYGAARGVEGLAIVCTLGTGIGSALLTRGHLVPNTELGHLEIDGFDAETRASSAAREREDLSWEQWAKRLQRYFSHLEMLFSPEIFVVGGGVSKRHNNFLPLLDLRAPIVPAALRNSAGIVGAAARAHYLSRVN